MRWSTWFPNRFRLVTLSRCAAVAIALSPLMAHSAFADPPAGLDDFVNAALKKYNTPGTSVAVIEGDHIYTRGYGVRSINKPDKVDGDTLFMIASCTKSFTAALDAIMVDQGKFGWDDHVIDYLPEFQLKDYYATRMCTPRDLLAHRSGLPAFTGDALESLGFSRDEIMRRIRFIEPACSFREKANYSNPGVFVAGMLAARTGGGTYEELVQRKLYDPLNMTRSGFSPKDHNKDNVADGHSPLPQGGSKVEGWDETFGLGPAGELTSTANDLAHFVQMQLNDGKFNGKQIISAENIKEMHKPAMVDEPTFAEMAPIDAHSGFSFALGWDVYHYKGHEIIEKAGARLGMRSVMTLVPDKKLGIVVLSNQNLTAVPEAVRAYLLDNMVAKNAEWPKPVRSFNLDNLKPDDEQDNQAKILAAWTQLQKVFTPKPHAEPTGPLSLPLASYAGKYECKLYGPMEVFVDGDKLGWRAGPEHVSGPMYPIAHNTFEFHWPPNHISLPDNATFTISEKGIPTVLTTDSFGAMNRVSDKQ